jgi:hypothetical protein
MFISLCVCVYYMCVSIYLTFSSKLVILVFTQSLEHRDYELGL